MVKNNAKDPRYDTVKNLILGGYISEFRQIFVSLPKSTLYRDLGMNNLRFKKLMYHVDGFVLKDIFSIAKLIGVDREKILELIVAQFYKDLEEKGISDKPKLGK